jgi:signal transduction histidine kinase
LSPDERLPTRPTDAPLYRVFVGAAATLLALQIILLLAWGRGYVPFVFPWYGVFADTFTLLAGLTVAFVAFARYHVLGEPGPFWIGMAFLGFGLLAGFNTLIQPNMLSTQPVIVTATANLSSWFWHLKFTGLAIGLLIALLARWPRPGQIGERFWPGLALGESIALFVLGALLVAHEASLPVLVNPDLTVSRLNATWSLILLVAFAIGAALSLRWYLRTGDSLFGFVAITQLVLAFAMLADIIGTRLYDVWWYWRRMVWVGALLVMLIGLLMEYVRLFRREQARTQQLEALQGMTDALVREIELSGVTRVIIERSRDVLGVDAVAVWLVDTWPLNLNLIASRGLSSSFVETIRRRIPGLPDVQRNPARLEETHVIEDVSVDDMPASERERFLREGLRAVVSLPLHVRGRLVGVVGFGSRARRHFSAADLGFISTIADLFAVAIENARLYEEIRHALQLREEFMSAAAHELRSPVAVIKGRTQFTLKTDAREPEARHALEEILRASDRITRLTNDLLAVIRVRPNQVMLSQERLDLGALVRATAEDFARSLAGHEVRIETADGLIVDVDRALIGEVLNRLLENAARYAPEGQPIDIAAYREDAEAIVSVTDHGVGIPFERQAYVFEPFYEYIAPGTPGYVGLVSLGLYLSKQIVNAHGGRIWYFSHPSEGSTFSLSLPLVRSVGESLAGRAVADGD